MRYTDRPHPTRIIRDHEFTLGSQPQTLERPTTPETDRNNRIAFAYELASRQSYELSARDKSVNYQFTQEMAAIAGTYTSGTIEVVRNDREHVNVLVVTGDQYEEPNISRYCLLHPTNNTFPVAAFFTDYPKVISNTDAPIEYMEVQDLFDQGDLRLTITDGQCTAYDRLSDIL